MLWGEVTLQDMRCIEAAGGGAEVGAARVVLLPPLQLGAGQPCSAHTWGPGNTGERSLVESSSP